jgi:hypothetical protein
MTMRRHGQTNHDKTVMRRGQYWQTDHYKLKMAAGWLTRTATFDCIDTDLTKLMQVVAETLIVISDRLKAADLMNIPIPPTMFIKSHSLIKDERQARNQKIATSLAARTPEAKRAQRRRIAAVWAARTLEERQAIIDKRNATRRANAQKKREREQARWERLQAREAKLRADTRTHEQIMEDSRRKMAEREERKVERFIASRHPDLQDWYREQFATGNLKI